MSRLPAILCLLWAFPLFAQRVPVIRFTEENGLPHAIVYRITQDKQGYIWFSTDNGLSRYDGSHFTNFYREDGLGSSFIFGTHQLKSGQLLISAYENGVVSYSKGQFKVYKPANRIAYPIDFFPTKKGLFVSDRTLQIYLNNRKIKHVSGRPCKLSSILECRDGQILGFGNTIYRYSPHKKQFVPQLEKNNQTRFYNCGAELKNGGYVIAESSGLYQLSKDFKKLMLVMPGAFSGSRKAIFKDHLQQIWVADLNGKLWLFSPSLKSKRLIASDVTVNQLFEDRDGNIWVATYGQGVWCIPNPKILNHNVRGELVKDIGLIKYNGKTYCIPLIHRDFDNFQTNPTTGLKRYKPSDFFRRETSVAYSTVNNEFVIAGQLGLYFDRPGNQRSRSYQLRNTSITKIFQTSVGEYWIGSRSGLLHIDLSKDSTQTIRQIDQHIVYDICETRNGDIALATSQGVYVKEGKKWQHYDEASGFPDPIINTVKYNKQSGHLWVGTNGGIFYIDRQHKVHRFRQLKRTRCNDIETDKRGRVWFATTEGLYARDGQRLYFFGQQFGFQSGIRKMIYDSESNTLYALFYNHMLEVPLRQLFRKPSRQKSRIQIEKILIDNKEQQPGKRTCTFSDYNHSLMVHFSHPNFNYSNQNRLFYQLNKDVLIPISGQQVIRLYNLPYGTNHLKIIALDINGKTISDSTLMIRYPQPFYRSNWFMVVAFLLLLTGGMLIIQRYLKNKHMLKEKQFDTQQQLAELRQKSLQNMLNPHFLNNAINSIQAFVVRNDQRNTLRYLSKLAKLMRLNLELLESSFVSLKKELENIELYLQFEQIRSGEKLHYHIAMDEHIDLEHFLIPAFILQPYVENAIWHGILPKQGSGNIHIRLERLTEGLQITITDDGIGIEASTKKKKNAHKISRGTRIIHERLELLNHRFPGFSVTITELKGISKSGTEVTIQFPVIEAESDVIHKK